MDADETQIDTDFEEGMGRGQIHHLAFVEATSLARLKRFAFVVIVGALHIWANRDGGFFALRDDAVVAARHLGNKLSTRLFLILKRFRREGAQIEVWSGAMRAGRPRSDRERTMEQDAMSRRP